MDTKLTNFRDSLKNAGVIAAIDMQFYPNDPRVVGIFCPDGDKVQDMSREQWRHCCAGNPADPFLHRPSYAGSILRVVQIPSNPRGYHRDALLYDIEIAMKYKKTNIIACHVHIPCGFAEGECGLTPPQTLMHVPEAKQVIRAAFPKAVLHVYVHFGFQKTSGLTYAFRRDPWLRWAETNAGYIQSWNTMEAGTSSNPASLQEALESVRP